MDMTAATKVPSTRKYTRKFLIQKNSKEAGFLDNVEISA